MQPDSTWREFAGTAGVTSETVPVGPHPEPAGARIECRQSGGPDPERIVTSRPAPPPFRSVRGARILTKFATWGMPPVEAHVDLPLVAGRVTGIRKDLCE